MITTNGRGPGAARPSRRTLWILGGGIAGLIVVSAALGTVLALEGVGVPPRPKPLPGLMTGPAPWGPNTAQLRARLKRLGLTLERSLGRKERIHLDVSVAGHRVQVPRGIGIPRDEALMVAPAFTNDTSGSVAVTSPLRLGQLFGIWGLRFTKSCLGGYCKKPIVMVNGARVPGNPRRLLLRDGQEIVVSVQR
jgi:hypothetical protein